VIPEIDSWRVANLILKRYGDTAQVESARRADELAADGDIAGAAVWWRIINAVDQLANTTPPGRVTESGDLLASLRCSVGSRCYRACAQL
jgi:hypothetical protein